MRLTARTIPPIAAVLCAATLGACGGARGGAETSPEPRHAGTDHRYIEAARADSARYPYTEADVHFMTGMVGHHAQAIVMAGWAPTHGASPAIVRLAERIINAQHDEIATMQRWLADRRRPVPEARPRGMTMTVDGVEHEMMMPGMLTDAELEELDQARGAEFDRLFLTYMIQHHKGAVAMVKTLFGSYGAGQDEVVFKFASDVNVDQATEIARMERMLAALLVQGQSP